MRRVILGLKPVAAIVVTVVYSQEPGGQTIGPTGGGGFLLNSGWLLRPARKNIPLSTQVLAPDGRMPAVSNVGYAPASVSLLNMETSRESVRVPPVVHSRSAE